jgi:hypothetical protein
MRGWRRSRAEDHQTIWWTRKSAHATPHTSMRDITVKKL